MTQFDYSPPVSDLLALADPREMDQWPDYLAMGFTTEHLCKQQRAARRKQRKRKKKK